MSESTEPRVRSVCVFCGSSSGARPEFAAAARAFGAALARSKRTLVWGGGRVGLMGAVADGALADGGRVIGVIPKALEVRELAHERATKMHVVQTMHERKALMADLADAFVALPGGFGTFDELFEVLTWAQLGFHAKPVGLLDVERYFEPLLALADRAVLDGFVARAWRERILVDTDAVRLIAALESHGGVRASAADDARIR